MKLPTQEQAQRGKGRQLRMQRYPCPYELKNGVGARILNKTFLKAVMNPMGISKITETRCLRTNLTHAVTNQFLTFEQPDKGCDPEQRLQMSCDESVNTRDMTVVCVQCFPFSFSQSLSDGFDICNS